MWSKNNQKDMDDLSNSSNIISKGTILTGNLQAHGNIRVEGKIIGDITTRSKLALGNSSLIEGNILAQNAEFAGTIIGNVQVTEQLVLKSTAIIKGDLSVNKLIVPLHLLELFEVVGAFAASTRRQNKQPKLYQLTPRHLYYYQKGQSLSLYFLRNANVKMAETHQLD